MSRRPAAFEGGSHRSATHGGLLMSRRPAAFEGGSHRSATHGGLLMSRRPPLSKAARTAVQRTEVC
jgi:hypothetical protein